MNKTVVIAMAVALSCGSASAQQFKVLHSFTGGSDGSYPYAGLVQDTKGNIYGAAADGGSDPLCPLFYIYGCGVIFVLDGNREERVILRFHGVNGALPYGTPTLDSHGNVYGTTSGGGATGSGTVFVINKLTRTERFYSMPPFSDYIFAGVVRDQVGNLYGTTTTGLPGDGTVFELTRSGERILHTFTGSKDGRDPEFELLIDGAGNLYGTTIYGGPFGDNGTVFEITAERNFTVLYAFTGGADGGGPDGPLMMDAQSNLYGTTGGGGVYGCGTVFKLDTTGKETVIHSFDYTDGISPVGNLAMDENGNIYGTTVGGGVGSPAAGTVFKLDAAGNATVLHNFDGLLDGGTPNAGVIIDAKGNLYGTTTIGGSGNCDVDGYLGCGVVFEITP